MFPKKLKNDTGGLAKTALIIIIVLVMLSASTVAIVLYQGNQDANNKANRTVVKGDAVKVNFIGKITVGGVERVFDTSMLDVAYNTSIAKSLLFNLKSNASYVPLSFTIGAGTVITGFNNAVIGMKVGETKIVDVSPSQGYGNTVMSKVTTFNLNESKSIFVNMTFAEFKTKYSVVAAAGMTVVDPVYKWPVNVLIANSDADLVRIQNAPVQGQNYLIYSNSTQKAAGWNITVTSVNTSVSEAGQIDLVHDITYADTGMIKGVDEKGTAFVLDNVSASAGTAWRNANTHLVNNVTILSELVGKTLTFTITLTAIA
jgi:peptidylprolyl isomerase